MPHLTIEARRAWATGYRKANREKVRAYGTAWAALHPAGGIAWKKAHPEKVRAIKAAWDKAHPEEMLAKNRAWRKAHPDMVLAFDAAWRAANREKVNASSSKWARANPDKVRANKQSRRARELAATVDPFSDAELEAHLDALGRWCSYCPGGRYEALDHVVPLKPRKGDPKGAHALSNLVPACARCNSAKHNKPLAVWAPCCANRPVSALTLSPRDL